MKRFLVIIVILVLCAAAVFQFGDSFQRDTDGLTLTEAAFSVRSEETSDSTSFLVGRFLCDDGSRIVFDGCGGVTRFAANLEETQGSYSLTQAENGAAVIRVDLGSGAALYTFTIVSPEGQFTLTDAANVVHTFTPVE